MSGASCAMRPWVHGEAAACHPGPLSEWLSAGVFSHKICSCGEKCRAEALWSVCGWHLCETLWPQGRHPCRAAEVIHPPSFLGRLDMQVPLGPLAELAPPSCSWCPPHSDGGPAGGPWPYPECRNEWQSSANSWARVPACPSAPARPPLFWAHHVPAAAPPHRWMTQCARETFDSSSFCIRVPSIAVLKPQPPYLGRWLYLEIGFLQKYLVKIGSWSSQNPMGPVSFLGTQTQTWAQREDSRAMAEEAANQELPVIGDSHQQRGRHGTDCP